MEKCKRCKNYTENAECVDCQPNYKTSKADKIRSMDDEELAEFLLKVNTAYAESCMTGEKDCKWEDYPTHDKDCKDCFLDWLQSEVEPIYEEWKQHILNRFEGGSV